MTRIENCVQGGIYTTIRQQVPNPIITDFLHYYNCENFAIVLTKVKCMRIWIVNWTELNWTGIALQKGLNMKKGFALKDFLCFKCIFVNAITKFLPFRLNWLIRFIKKIFLFRLQMEPLKNVCAYWMKDRLFEAPY